MDRTRRSSAGAPVSTIDPDNGRGRPRGAILVVSGDPSEARALAASLSSAACGVRTASDVEGALRAISGGEEEGPEVIVMGRPLEGSRCRLLPEAAGEREARTRIPILAVIPEGSESERRRAIEEGADEVLARPFDDAVLLDRVRSLARIHRLEIEVVNLRGLHQAGEQRLAAVRAERSALGHKISHDLGNPLTGILGHAQMMQMKCAGAPEVDRYAGRILKAARQMQQILADLRDLGLLEEGQMPLRVERIDLYAAVASVVGDFREVAAAESVTVEVEPPRPPSGRDGTIVRADSGLFLRVLGNLLADAVRHTPPDGTVRVHVGAPADGRVEVHVSDISVSEREPGANGHDGDGATPGPLRTSRPERGLRLAFCRAALAAHGGRMWVKPNAAGGDTLGFLLPVEA